MKIDLNEVAKEIREILEKRRLELDLTFVEDTHTYYMKDLDGKVRDNYPSVSKVMKIFYDEFPAEEISLKKANGDLEVQKVAGSARCGNRPWHGQYAPLRRRSGDSRR